MAIEFREVTSSPLCGFSATAPDGALIGVVGEKNAGQGTLLQLAAGALAPATGKVVADEPRRYLGPSDGLNFAPVRTLLLEHTLATHDAVVRGRALMGLDRMRRTGTTVLLVSHELSVLRSLCDEVWWLQEGALTAKGDPREVLDKYQRHVGRKLQEWGEKLKSPGLLPTLRRGSGAAEVLRVEMLNAQGQSTMVWQSGEPASIRLTVRFREAVTDPVVGFLIRTRMGLDAYGTNTEIEGTRLGAVAEGETLRVSFQFSCDLCAQEYSLTVGSHTQDGLWQDWLDDALGFSVVNSRASLGVANLRARVVLERMATA